MIKNYKGFTPSPKSLVLGFTLIELLVVISILGILIAVSIFGTAGARESSRDARRKSDLEMVRSGLEMYKADCNVYPASLDFSGSGTLTGTCPTTSNTYIAEIPSDPITGRNYCYYRTTTGGYELYASLEQSSGSSLTCSGGNCGSGTCNYKVTNP